MRLELDSGETVKGTLMRADESAMLIQRAARIPEAPVEVPTAKVRALELDRGTGLAKAVAIGAAAGVGATFGVLFLIFAMVED